VIVDAREQLEKQFNMQMASLSHQNQSGSRGSTSSRKPSVPLASSSSRHLQQQTPPSTSTSSKGTGRSRILSASPPNSGGQGLMLNGSPDSQRVEYYHDRDASEAGSKSSGRQISVTSQRSWAAVGQSRDSRRVSRKMKIVTPSEKISPFSFSLDRKSTCPL
jgi:hypothetical protein